MGIQKVAKGFFTYALACLSKHPSNRLVHEVVLVGKKPRSNGKYHLPVPFHDRVETRKHDNAVRPKMRTLDAFVYEPVFFFCFHRLQIRSEDVPA